jgi:putative spermidine/putrescine transport system ATP-binding protein
VYGQPANIHVARFMGYRNVIELPVEREEGERVVLGGLDMQLVGTRKQALGNGKALVAMRPEEITLLPAGAADGVNRIEGRVDNVEYGGRDSLVDVITAGGTRVHVRAPGTHRQGDAVRLSVPIERVLVYPHE